MSSLDSSIGSSLVGKYFSNIWSGDCHKLVLGS